MAAFALVGAAEFNQEDFRRRYLAQTFACVIAVDGGYAHLRQAGIAPDVALGDFDSLGYVPNHEHLVQHPPIKDKSDLELALDLAIEQGAKQVWAYGCLGGRIDHTLAALQSLCAAAEKGLDVVAIGCPMQDGGHDQGSAVSILAGPACLHLSAEGESNAALKGVVSVHSVCNVCHGVTETGLLYEIHDADLTNRTSLGLSNQLVGKPASICVRQGTLLVVHPSNVIRNVIVLT